MAGAPVLETGLRLSRWLLVLAAAVTGALVGIWLFDHYHPDPWEAAAFVVFRAWS